MGGDGLNGYKANLNPAKLKLADIGLELSLAIERMMIGNLKRGTEKNMGN